MKRRSIISGLILVIATALAITAGTERVMTEAATKNYKILIWSYGANTAAPKSGHLAANEMARVYQECVPAYLEAGATVSVVNSVTNNKHFTGTEDLAADYDMVVVFLPGNTAPAGDTVNSTDIDVFRRYVSRGGRILLQCEVGNWCVYDENQIGSYIVEQLGGCFHIASGSEQYSSISYNYTSTPNLYSTIMGGRPLAGSGKIYIGCYANVVTESLAEVVSSMDPECPSGNFSSCPMMVDQAIGNGRVTVMSDFNWYAGIGGNCAKLSWSEGMSHQQSAYDLLGRILTNSAYNKEMVALGINPNEGFGEEHDLSFSVNGNTITATCSEEDCSFKDHRISLSLYASNQATYGSASFTYTGIGMSKSNFTTFAKAALGDVMYEGTGSTSYTKTTAAPKSVGTYEASMTVTIGGTVYTLRKQFKITLDGVKMTVGSNEITIEDASPAYEYYLFDNEGNRVGSPKRAPEGGGDIVFSGLAQDMEYVIKYVDKDVADDAASIGKPLDEEDFESEEVLTKISVSQLAPHIERGIKAISVSGLNSDYQYALAMKTNGKPGDLATFWTSPDESGEILFDELGDGTAYYLIARNSTNDESEGIETSTLSHIHDHRYYADGSSICYSCLTISEYECDDHEPVKVTLVLQETSAVSTDYACVERDDEWEEMGLLNPVVLYSTASDDYKTTFAGKPTEPGHYKAILVVSDDDISCRVSQTFTINEDGDVEAGYVDEDANGDSEPSYINRSAGFILYDAQLHRDDVIRYATDSDGNTSSTTYINMTKEVIVTDITVAAYSLNGTSWKQGDLAALNAILSKSLSNQTKIRIATEYNEKTKKGAGTIYSFGTIKRREATTKFTVNYYLCRDAYGVTNGQWCLTNKNIGVNLSSYEIGICDDGKGKEIGAKGYGVWPAEGVWPSCGGVWISDLPATGKTGKEVYLYRKYATENAPASKPVKLTVTTVLAPSKIKVDYKKESVKLKEGMSIYFGNGVPSFEDGQISINKLPAEREIFSDYAGKALINITKNEAKKALDISGYITGTRNVLTIWQSATAKKARTAPQIITLAARAAVPTAEQCVTVANGAAKLIKGYEIRVGSKWTTTIPKVTKNVEYQIRFKTNAKAGAENDTTYASGLIGTLKLTYGVYDEAKKKSGCIGAVVE